MKDNHQARALTAFAHFYRVKRHTLRALAIVTAGVLVISFSGNAALANRNERALISMDHQLLRADFIGTVHVVSAKETGSGLVELVLEITDTWRTRWAQRTHLTIRTIANFDGLQVLAPESDHLVLLSGGAWQESPFTTGKNSIFTIDHFGAVSCVSGNPLMSITQAGFWCSIPELTAGSQFTLPQTKERMMRLIHDARQRHPDLLARLRRAHRELEQVPRMPQHLSLESEVAR